MISQVSLTPKQMRLIELVDRPNSEQEIIALLKTMQSRDVAPVALLKPSVDWGYLTACADGILCVFVGYYLSVLGKPPYTEALDLQLTKADIKQFQDDWRRIGVEPLESNYRDDEESMPKHQEPTFSGETFQEFKRHMQTVVTNLVDVATNVTGDDERTCISGLVISDSTRGYLIAVRDSKDTDPEILDLTKKLHDRIQQVYEQKKDAPNVDD